MTLTGGSAGRPARPVKAGETIAAYLRTRIVRGELVEGDNLPSELELMERFEVSRPTLREAFRILETEQLISIRRGSRGARILAPDITVAARYTGLLLQTTGTTLADVHEARTAYEPAAAGMLARVRTSEDIADLEACQQAYARLVADIDTPDRHRDEDVVAGLTRLTDRFQSLIVERCGNRTLAIQHAVLREVIATHLAQVMRRESARPGPPSRLRAAARSYQRLIDLVVARDAAGAQVHWRTHLEAASQVVLVGELSSTTVLDLFN